MEKNGYFDYIFIGAGASSTLLLRSLESRGLLANKKIAVIDSDSKSTNDKTYCFWTSLDDDIAQDCNALISENWSKVSVNQQNPESLENQEYSETHLNTLMKEYKKNMDNRDIVFENRKQTFASNAAPVGDNVEASNENNDVVELDAVKEEIEKVDAWSERNT